MFTAHLEKATAKQFYVDLKSLVREMGRDADQVLVLPGFSPVIGSTEAEARRYAGELNELADPEIGRQRLSLRFGGHDFSHLPLDKKLKPADFPDPERGRGVPQPDRGHRRLCPGRSNRRAAAAAGKLAGAAAISPLKARPSRPPI